MNIHQYIDRRTSQIKTETLYQDRIVNMIYSKERENSRAVFNALTSARFSKVLGFLNYDMPLGAVITGAEKFADTLGIALSECLDPPESLNTARKIFERKIRYWQTRPMPSDDSAIVSPADAKVLVGSLCKTSAVFIKEKFFCYEELLGENKPEWLSAFRDGEFALFRLTPEKYHYNHCPVSGKVLDIYEISGSYLPCNPGVVSSLVSPFSKNKRVVTIIDSDIEGGTGAGLVAMIEVAALMIGDVVQCYSDSFYDFPKNVTPGMFLEKGQPKSLYRPGSSTDLILFQKGNVTFADDILANMYRQTVSSRFSDGLGRTLVETDLDVRSQIASVIERKNDER